MLGYIDDAHGFGLEGVAAMRHRTMDVIRVNSTIGWSVLSKSPSLIRETVTLDTFRSQLRPLGDDHEILGIRMERLLDELIGHVRTVVVAGVDVVHARIYC